MQRDFLIIFRSSFLCLSLGGLLCATPVYAALDEYLSPSPAPSLSLDAPASAATGAPPASATTPKPAGLAVPPPAVAAPPTNPVAPLPPAVVLPPVVAPERHRREEPLFETDTWPLWAETAWENTSDVLHERLRVGLRYRQMNPTDGDRTAENSYLGSITKLEPLYDYDPITFVTFEWLANPYISFRFNMEQLRARTRTTSDDNHSDGDVNLTGPSLMLVLRLPNESRFTPFLGGGFAWFQSTFEHNPMWYNGFGGDDRVANYEAWLAAGSPPWPNNGYRREIILDDATALVGETGFEFRITDHLDISAFLSAMAVEEVGVTYNLSFGGNVFETTQAKFPMSSIGYGIALRWTF